MQLTPHSPHMRPVLIVDDDPDILMLLRETLALSGYPMRFAHNGVEALASAAAYTPSLVILDIMMPKMDGFQFLAELETQGVAIPVMVITASASPETQKRLQMLQGQGKITHVFTKPFSILGLMDAVGDIVTAQTPVQ